MRVPARWRLRSTASTRGRWVGWLFGGCSALVLVAAVVIATDFGTSSSAAPPALPHTASASEADDVELRTAELGAGRATSEVAVDTSAAQRQGIAASLRIVDDADGLPLAGAVVEFVDDEFTILAMRDADAEGRVLVPDGLRWSVATATAPGFGIVGIARSGSEVRVPRLRTLDVGFVDDSGLIGTSLDPNGDDPGLTFTFEIQAHHYRPRGLEVGQAAVATFARSPLARPFSSTAWHTSLPQPLDAPGKVSASAIHRRTGHRIDFGTAAFDADQRQVYFRVPAGYRDAATHWYGLRVRLPRPVALASVTSNFGGQGSSQRTSIGSPIDASGGSQVDEVDLVRIGDLPADTDVYVSVTTATQRYFAERELVEVERGQFVVWSPWSDDTTIDLEYIDAQGLAAVDHPSDLPDIDPTPRTHAIETIRPGLVRISHLPMGIYRLADPSASPPVIEVSPGTTAHAKLRYHVARRVRVMVHLPDASTANFLDPTTGYIVERMYGFPELKLTLPEGDYVLQLEFEGGRIERRTVHVSDGAVIDLR